MNSVSLATTLCAACVVPVVAVCVVDVSVVVRVVSVVVGYSPLASASEVYRAMKITADIIPTKKSTHVTMKTRRPRPGNCGR